AGLALALTLATEPELLVLDDPALGLDPVARRSLLESLVYATGEEGGTGGGKTILFSSHLLGEVERISDHLAILDHSVLRAQCSLETFRNSVKRFVLRFSGTGGVPPVVEAFPGLLEVFHGDRMLRITVLDSDAARSGMPPPFACRLNADSVEEVPVSFEDALTTYLSDHQENRLFLRKVEGAV
ncbi:MAG: hypothetical protein FWD53_12840, partial [Phycisphaerales bacterium]|nr:hypothetical protein [Phycisphaerales bacterium]